MKFIKGSSITDWIVVRFRDIKLFLLLCLQLTLPCSWPNAHYFTKHVFYWKLLLFILITQKPFNYWSVLMYPCPCHNRGCLDACFLSREICCFPKELPVSSPVILEFSKTFTHITVIISWGNVHFYLCTVIILLVAYFIRHHFN